jgi:hypothetical protein
MADTYDWSTCTGGDGNITMVFNALPAGTYYYPVMYSPSDQANSPYQVTVSTPVATGGCCAGTGCIVLTQADCAAQGGRYVGDYTDCGGLFYDVGQGTAFEDISATGSEFAPAETDDGGGEFGLPFTFRFYDVDYTTVGIASNGYLTFSTEWYTTGGGWTFPDPTVPNALIAAFWTDLVPAPGTAPVHTETRGTEPNRRLIVQWTNVPTWSFGGSNTFQIVLFETSNNIEFRYQYFDAWYYRWIEAGIENASGTVGIEMHPLVQPDSSVAITTRVEPSPCARGDMNCDGFVNFADINPFVMYLSNFALWQTTYSACPPQNGDMNGDGTYPSFADINPFVALLAGGGR